VLTAQAVISRQIAGLGVRA